MPISTPKTMLKAMVISLAVAVLLTWGIPLALAKEWWIDTTRTIAASPGAVRALVGDLGTWPKWSAMQAELGPQTNTQITGAAGTVGQSITWSGGRGAAVLQVTAIGEGSLEYEFRSQGAADAPVVVFARGSVGWQPDGTGCRVHWHEGNTCRLLERWFVWFGAVQERSRQIQVSSLEGLAQELEGASKPGAK